MSARTDRRDRELRAADYHRRLEHLVALARRANRPYQVILTFEDTLIQIGPPPPVATCPDLFPYLYGVQR